MRRVRTLAGQQTEDWGVWQVMTTDSEISLLGLDRGVEYDFRRVAATPFNSGLCAWGDL